LRNWAQAKALGVRERKTKIEKEEKMRLKEEVEF